MCLQKTHLVRDCPERTEEDKEYARLQKLKREDDEKGLRVKGLLSSEDVNLNDDYVAVDENYGNDGDDGDGDYIKPVKKQKKTKK